MIYLLSIFFTAFYFSCFTIHLFIITIRKLRTLWNFWKMKNTLKMIFDSYKYDFEISLTHFIMYDVLYSLLKTYMSGYISLKWFQKALPFKTTLLVHEKIHWFSQYSNIKILYSNTTLQHSNFLKNYHGYSNTKRLYLNTTVLPTLKSYS